eukprot:superscaffoldBa00000430_g4682
MASPETSSLSMKHGVQVQPDPSVLVEAVLLTVADRVEHTNLSFASRMNRGASTWVTRPCRLSLRQERDAVGMQTVRPGNKELFQAGAGAEEAPAAGVEKSMDVTSLTLSYQSVLQVWQVLTFHREAVMTPGMWLFEESLFGNSFITSKKVVPGGHCSWLRFAKKQFLNVPVLPTVKRKTDISMTGCHGQEQSRGIQLHVLQLHSALDRILGAEV